MATPKARRAARVTKAAAVNARPAGSASTSGFMQQPGFAATNPKLQTPSLQSTDYQPGVSQLQGPTSSPQFPLNFRPTGTPGLRHSGGYVIEEFLRKLIGRPGVQQYREIFFNSPQVGAIMYFISTLVRQVKWRFEPNPDSKNKKLAADNAEFFTQCMHDMEHTWPMFIESALSYLPFGWSRFERLYKYRRGPLAQPELRSKYNDGRIAWRSFEQRSQDTMLRWEIHRETGSVLGMWQQDPWSGKPTVFLPNEDCVHFTNRKYKNNPEGISLFRNSVIPYLRLKRIEEIEAIGIERDLTGLLVMEVPATILNPEDPASSAIKDGLEEMLSGIKADERAFAMIPTELDHEGKPTGYKLRLLAGGGSKQLDIVAIKNSYKTDIFQSALVQFLTLGQQQNGGSFSLHSDASSLAAMSTGAVCDDIAETFQKQAVEPLAYHNKMQPDDVPLLKHGDIEKPEQAKIAQLLQVAFTTNTLQPSEALDKWMHELLGAPYDNTTPKVDPQQQALADQLVQEGGKEERGPAQDISEPAARGQASPSQQQEQKQ